MVHFHVPIVRNLVQRHRERKMRREQKLLVGNRARLEQQQQQRGEHTGSRRHRHQRRSRHDNIRHSGYSTVAPTPSATKQDKQRGPYHHATRSPDQPIGFSFSGGGWLMVYLYGVAKGLREYGLHKDARLIGTSAGALAIIGWMGESNFDAMVETIVTSYVPRVHWSHTGPFQMREYLIDAVTRHVPAENVYKVNGICTVVYTSLSGWEARKVSQFRDFNHLLWTMVASCCATPLVGLPFKHEGEWVVDGGIMENQPEFPDVVDAEEDEDDKEGSGDDSDDEEDRRRRQQRKANKPKPLKTVTVSPNIYSGADIRPSRYVPAWWSMYPPSERDMRWLYELGYEDALQWIVREEAVPDADEIVIPTRGASYDGEWKTVIGQVVGYRWIEDKALTAVALLHLSTKTTASTFLRVEMAVWKFLAVLTAAVDRVAIIWTVLATGTLVALVLLNQHHTLEFVLVAASHLSVAIMKVGSAYRQVDGSEQWKTLQSSVMALIQLSRMSHQSTSSDSRASFGRPTSESLTLTPEQHEALAQSSYIYRMSSSFV